MCPAIPITDIYGFNRDDWNASAYAALSTAWRTSGALKQQALFFRLAFAVWTLDKNLREFLETFYEAVENPPVTASEAVTQDQILDAAKILRDLHATIDRVYTQAKGRGLTNYPVLGAFINSVKTQSEEILEIADALSLSVDNNVDAMLDRALDDLHGGRVYDLPTFK